MVRPGEQAYAVVPGAHHDHHDRAGGTRRPVRCRGSVVATLAAMADPDDVTR